MSWNCDSCNSENDDDIIRCTCGKNSGEPVKNLMPAQPPENISSTNPMPFLKDLLLAIIIIVGGVFAFGLYYEYGLLYGLSPAMIGGAIYIFWQSYKSKNPSAKELPDRRDKRGQVSKIKFEIWRLDPSDIWISSFPILTSFLNNQSQEPLPGGKVLEGQKGDRLLF